MEMKLHYDARVVLSFSEYEILQLVTFLQCADLDRNARSLINQTRTYDAEELETFVDKLVVDINRTVEDRLVD